MKCVSRSVLFLGIVLLTGSLAMAQAPAGASGQAAPEPMTNLQVFPKDTTRAQINQMMNAFDDSLGIKCEYCHVQLTPGGKFDFASDDKREKRVARRMVQLRDSINSQLPTVTEKIAGGPGGAPTRLLCSTCHRGQPIPKQIDAIVAETSAGGAGAAAGLAKFKELRAQYYGGQSYDFSEASLVAIAGRSANGGKFDDAMLYLQANLEYFPNSSSTYQGMANVKNLKGDKPGAIADLQKAISLDPNNKAAKDQLAKLTAQ